MKIERYDNETDEEWDDRLAEEVSVANDYKDVDYFVQRDPCDEHRIIINYIYPGAWTWKEHPEGPFTCKQIMEWKHKYHLWEELMRLGSEIKSFDALFQWIVDHITIDSCE